MCVRMRGGPDGELQAADWGAVCVGGCSPPLDGLCERRGVPRCVEEQEEQV